MTPRPAPDRAFFLRMGLLLILLILAGFGGRALTEREENSPDAPVLIPHIVCIGGWYLLLVLQAALIGWKRRPLHRKLGYASLPLAVGLLWTGAVVMAENYRIQGKAPLAFFNVTNLTQFALMYAFAVGKVKDTGLHKRLMLYGSIAMMPPALVRMIQAVGLPEPTTLVLVVGLWIPGILHDRKHLGRVHRGTWIGVGAIVAGIAASPIGFSSWWAELLDSWIGRAG